MEGESVYWNDEYWRERERECVSEWWVLEEERESVSKWWVLEEEKECVSEWRSFGESIGDDKKSIVCIKKTNS